MNRSLLVGQAEITIHLTRAIVRLAVMQKMLVQQQSDRTVAMDHRPRPESVAITGKGERHIIAMIKIFIITSKDFITVIENS